MYQLFQLEKTFIDRKVHKLPKYGFAVFVNKVMVPFLLVQSLYISPWAILSWMLNAKKYNELYAKETITSFVVIMALMYDVVGVRGIAQWWHAELPTTTWPNVPRVFHAFR